MSSASNLDSAKLSGLIWSIPLAVALLTLGGFGMLLNFRLEILGREFGGSPTGGILLGIFIGILVIDWVLLRQLSRFIKSFQPPVNSGKQILSEPSKHLPPTGAAPESASVNENPTRLFEVCSKELSRAETKNVWFDKNDSSDLRARAAKTNSE